MFRCPNRKLAVEYKERCDELAARLGVDAPSIALVLGRPKGFA